MRIAGEEATITTRGRYDTDADSVEGNTDTVGSDATRDAGIDVVFVHSA